ncbi:MAG: DnaJ domain-containing protein [Bacteroidia bacterium]
MKLVNYYQILEIEASATEQEIKRAFRKLAKKYHPDVNHNSEAPEHFKNVYMAYEVLSDPYKKRLYDELKEESKTQGRQYDQENQSSDAGFNYDAGFDQWEYRAQQRANHYANMGYEQFKKQELRGLDFFYHQLSLFIGMFGLFFVGGLALFFAKRIILAVINEKAAPISLFGAIIVGAFGLTILWYVIKMSGAFRKTFASRFRRKSK